MERHTAEFAVLHNFLFKDVLVVVLVELTLLLFKSNDGFAMIPLSSIFA